MSPVPLSALAPPVRKASRFRVVCTGNGPSRTAPGHVHAVGGHRNAPRRHSFLVPRVERGGGQAGTACTVAPLSTPEYPKHRAKAPTGMGSPVLHLHRDWAHPSHICIRAGLAPPMDLSSCRSVGSSDAHTWFRAYGCSLRACTHVHVVLAQDDNGDRWINQYRIKSELGGGSFRACPRSMRSSCAACSRAA